MSPVRTAALLFCLAVLSLSILPPAIAGPLATVAITRVSNLTVVCALIPSRAAGNRYDINCTALPLGIKHNYPARISSYTAIAAGDGFLCALTSPPSSGRTTMRWWDLTQERNGEEPRAKRLYNGSQLSELGAGRSHVCARVRNTGEIRCWRWTEFPSLKGRKLASIAVGGSFLCGLSPERVIECFGSDDNVVGKQPSGRYSLVAAGRFHACAVAENGSYLTCWGSGAPQVGRIDFEVTSLSLGDNRTCALSSDGRVRCWGAGMPESLRTVEFLSIHAQGSSICGVRNNDFALVCWGNEIFSRSQVVFGSVLPGPCGTNCTCGIVDGSGNLCPDGGSICRPCEVERNPISPSAGPSNSTNFQKGSGGNGDGRRRVIYVVLGAVGLGVGIAAVGIFLCCRSGPWLQVHDSGPADQEAASAVAGGRSEPAAASANGRTPVEPASVHQRLGEFARKGHSSTIEEFPLQVLLEVTGGFSEEHKIGSGSFGAVYRATLDDGREVAIKRAEICSSSSHLGGQTRRQDDKEQAFLAELGLLSRVNHKNLVRLEGFCWEGGERVLVYEYVANGTLSDHLHSLPRSPLATWDARLRVALDAARGIEYLHRYAVPPIIHRDIKSSNILLSDVWTAKVSDFGLSLMGPEEDVSHISLRAAGTVGYMDPEYYRLQYLTTKSDVYSFGVVLLELLTGFKAIHQHDGDDEDDEDDDSGGVAPRNVVDFAVPHIDADQVHIVLDGRLPPPKPSEIESVQWLAYLAADCVSPEGRSRPTMTEVVSTLEKAVATCATAAPPFPRSLSTQSL